MPEETMSAEEVLMQEKLKGEMVINVGKKEETSFSPLVDGMYELSVIRTEVRIRDDKFNPGEQETVLILICSVDKCVTEESIKDQNGKEYKAEERSHWEWLTISKVGKGGPYMPAKTRNCIGAFLKCDPNGDLKMEHPDEFVEKKVRVFLESYTKQDKSIGQRSIKYSQCS